MMAIENYKNRISTIKRISNVFYHNDFKTYKSNIQLDNFGKWGSDTTLL
jgi:hypothetical protein